MTVKTIAIFSDIHANYPALCAVTSDIRQQSIDSFWFLGDILDRGPFPVQCYRSLDNLIEKYPASEWLVGNHDLAICGQMEYRAGMQLWFTPIQEHHHQMMKRYEEGLERKTKYLFQTLQFNDFQINAFLSHGLPVSPNNFMTTYVEKYAPEKTDYLDHFHDAWDESDVEDFKKIGNANILICGHSHAFTCWLYQNECWEMGIKDFGTGLGGQMTWGERKESSPGLVETVSFDARDLTDNNLLIINPGSVGFPRVRSLETATGNARADYVLLKIDSESEKITLDFRSVEYETDLLSKKLDELEYPAEARRQMAYSLK